MRRVNSGTRIKIGDIVVVHDDIPSQSGNWQRGPDDALRSATIRTANGITSSQP